MNIKLLYNYYIIYIYRKNKVDNIIFYKIKNYYIIQQILSGKLLTVVIIGAKK